MLYLPSGEWSRTIYCAGFERYRQHPLGCSIATLADGSQFGDDSDGQTGDDRDPRRQDVSRPATERRHVHGADYRRSGAAAFLHEGGPEEVRNWENVANAAGHGADQRRAGGFDRLPVNAEGG